MSTEVIAIFAAVLGTLNLWLALRGLFQPKHTVATVLEEIVTGVGRVVIPGVEPCGFEVRVAFPFDDDWLEVDNAVTRAAGRCSDWGGAGGGVRDCGWLVPAFDEAVAMRAAVARVPRVTATIRESTTHTV